MLAQVDQIKRMDHEGFLSVLHGQHGDPFAVLGPHNMEDGATSVVSFLPGALAVDVVDRGSKTTLTKMNLVEAGGVFRAVVSELPAYSLKVHWPDAIQVIDDPYSFGPLLSDFDLHLISQGTHYRLASALGANEMVIDDVPGVRFAVWAPNARRVSVVGDFNSWNGTRHPMRLRQQAGVWELFIPQLTVGERYKFEILDANGQVLPQKADPVARAAEPAPSTASVVASSEPVGWTDGEWMERRSGRSQTDQPVSIYEVHAGSWLRDMDEGGRSLDWAELSQRLIPYVQELGFTHIELMPIAEYPFGGSWGYQPLGLFAPTGRYGTPEDFGYFVDRCHTSGIGVILDWVPAHFPSDIWGLARFDGTALYEHEDPREGYHRDWNTLIYNLGRNEVRGFLIASALEWLDRYHIDGLRVDAVASMLYRDYSRAEGEWIPNRYGGRENLEAIEFFKHLNSVVRQRHPNVLMIAEESTAFPNVTKSPEEGGLGFSMKWNMGWMHVTLHYMSEDPVYRKYHHSDMTFGMVYAFTERFILPFSHDEVVHGKRSLLEKMPGDEWQKFSNLRALYGFMWAHPGKKLLFMGGELGQIKEWAHDLSIEWDLLDHLPHRQLQRLVRDLNRIYRHFTSLVYGDTHPEGFEWAVVNDGDQSIIAMLRYNEDRGSACLVVSNFTPIPRYGYRIGVPERGLWRGLLSTDDHVYGGAGHGPQGVDAEPTEAHGRSFSVVVDLPPLSTSFFSWEQNSE